MINASAPSPVAAWAGCSAAQPAAWLSKPGRGGAMFVTDTIQKRDGVVDRFYRLAGKPDQERQIQADPGLGAQLDSSKSLLSGASLAHPIQLPLVSTLDTAEPEGTARFSDLLDIVLIDPIHAEEAAPHHAQLPREHGARDLLDPLLGEEDVVVYEAEEPR